METCHIDRPCTQLPENVKISLNGTKRPTQNMQEHLGPTRALTSCAHAQQHHLAPMGVPT